MFALINFIMGCQQSTSLEHCNNFGKTTGCFLYYTGEPVLHAPDDDDYSCYEARAAVLYNDWSSYIGDTRYPELDTLSANPSYVLGKGESSYMNNLTFAARTLLSATTALDQKLETAMDAANELVSDLVGDVGDLTPAEIGKAALLNNGAFAKANNALKLSDALLQQAESIKSSFESISFDALNAQVDEQAAAMAESVADFETTAHSEWEREDKAALDSFDKLQWQFKSMNATMQLRSLSAALEVTKIANKVYLDERALNSSIVTGIANVTLHNTSVALDDNDTDMSAMIDPDLIDSTRESLEDGVARDIDWLKIHAKDAGDLFIAHTQSQLSQTNTSLAQLQNEVAPDLSVFTADLNSSIKTAASRLDDVISRMESVPSKVNLSIIGREDVLQSATESEQVLIEYLHSQSDADAFEQALKQSAAIDKAQEAALSKLRDDTTRLVNDIFTRARASLVDMLDERDSFLDTAKSDVESVKSTISLLAADIGNAVSEFDASEEALSSAITNVTSDMNSELEQSQSVIAAKASSIATHLEDELDRSASDAALQLRASGDAIEAVKSNATAAASAVVSEVSSEVGSLKSNLSELASALLNSDTKLEESLANNATSEAVALKLLSLILSRGRRALDAIASQESSVGATGQGIYTRAADLVKLASVNTDEMITAVTNLTQLKQQEQLNFDRNEAELLKIAASAENQINKLHALIDNLQVPNDIPDTAGVKASLERHIFDIEQAAAKGRVLTAQQAHQLQLGVDSLLADSTAHLADAEASVSQERIGQVKLLYSEAAALADELVKLTDAATTIDNVSLVDVEKVTSAAVGRVNEISRIGHDLNDAFVAGSDYSEKRNDIQDARMRAVGLIRDVYNSQNSSLNGAVAALVRNVSQSLGAVLFNLSVTVGGIANSTFTKFNLTNLTVANSSESTDIGKDLEVMVDDMSNGSSNITAHVTSFLNDRFTKLDSTVTPLYSKLLNATAIYAGDVSANASQVGRTMAQVTFEAVAADTQVEQLVADSENRFQAEVSAMAGNSRLQIQAADALIANSTRVTRANVMKAVESIRPLRETMERSIAESAAHAADIRASLALLNSSRQQSFNNASKVIAGGIANVSVITKHLPSLAVGSRFAFDTSQAWAEWAEQSVRDLQSVPGVVAEDLTAMNASIAGSFAKIKVEVLHANESIADIRQQLDRLRDVASSFSEYPVVVNATIATLRARTANDTAIKELEQSLDALVSQRRAAAADHIRAINESLISLVASAKAKAAQLTSM